MNTDTLHQAPSQAELEGVLASIRIPACPTIVNEVMFEAQRDDPSIKVLTRILSSDVGMSAMAVKLANSPIFGGAAPVRSVQQAVSRLGISNILNVAMGLLGIIAVCIILYGGFKWMTAAGNDENVKSAKKLIIQGVIGLVVIVSAYAIAQFVISSLITATTSS